MRTVLFNFFLFRVSDDEPESEEEEDDPYPLDGKYMDEADMQRSVAPRSICTSIARR